MSACKKNFVNLDKNNAGNYFFVSTKNLYSILLQALQTDQPY